MKDKDEVTYGSFQSSISRRNFLTRAVTLGLSLSTVGISLQACSNNDTIESSLSFANWASAETATRNNIDKALQAFENQNSVQVNNIGIPFDQVQDQLTQAMRANITMDVMELSGNWPFVLAGSGALADLGPFVPQTWRNDAFSNSFEAGIYKGTLYAVPFSITPHGFWYSKSLLKRAGLSANQPPRTIDELNQAMTLLRANLPDNVYPIGIDTSKTEYALVGFWPWIWTFGGNPMQDNGNGQVTINWADDGTIAAFQWLQNAVKNRWTPSDLAIKDERQLMANDQLVFKLDGPYLTGILGNLSPAYDTVQKVNATFAVTTTPKGPGVTSPVTCADIHQLAISSSSTNKDLAWKLVNFLTTSQDVITSFLIPEGGMLPYKSFNTSPQLYSKYYSDAISRTFISTVIPTMRPPAYGQRYSTAAAAVVTALQEIAHGANVRTRLHRLTDEVKTIYT
ncbi:MAG: extracellular solute-binding protein [Ktedonobacteraceae bacterium]|nr:extracellular solute-binding protein [Ktedonobacteraceae bacterium]